MFSTDALLNDFARRCFRDIGDGDYIAARLANRANLFTQFLWASQQALDKYLKCILLLNRVPAADVKHDLARALSKIADANVNLDVTKSTATFIEYIDTYGRFRYLETSPYVFCTDIIRLDRAVWELRRFCTTAQEPRTIRLFDGVPVPNILLNGGYLEKIIDDDYHPAREPLLWQNGFFGRRTRKKVRVKGGFHATNSPLFLNPHIADEVEKYVFVPKELKAEYRKLRDNGDALAA